MPSQTERGYRSRAAKRSTWLDFSGHATTCDGSDSCPLGWLAIYSNRSGLVQPYDKAYKCRTAEFVSSDACLGAGKYWIYDYPDIRVSCIEPREVALRREITQMTSI